jgi:DNA invertase Pin-like site-specific DNA recombinase
MRIYGYLRASTEEQDASRAKNHLEIFAHELGHKVSAWFIENESGAKLHRPELFRLLDIAESGDVLLVENVDRISRLNNDDWVLLRKKIAEKGIRIVTEDLPTSHQLIQHGDEFTDRMLSAINSMMLDMLAAIARKDYEDRRKRQLQGIEKAKNEGKYTGRKENQRLHNQIEGLLLMRKSYGEIVETLNCSRSTISKVKRKMGFTRNQEKV